MLPTLEPGDFVLSNKMANGSMVINIWKLLVDRKIEYCWNKGSSAIKKNDVFVFNLPKYSTLNGKILDIYDKALVKRCYCIPGDSVIVRNKKVDYFGGVMVKQNLYPYDSTLNWTIENYGPLWVPGKGKVMQLNPENARHYHDVLLYEGYKTETRNDSVFLNGKYSANYTFKYNYYFMKGDNFYNSQDSRYWGFVPQTHVIGKVVLVLFSLDPDEPWYRCFRWGRFLKKIN